jgi:hypothetical protein
VRVFNPTGSLRGDIERTGRVVGVVPATANPREPGQAAPAVYVPYAQHPLRFVTFIVPERPSAVLTVRSVVAEVDPALVVDEARTLDQLLRSLLESDRLLATMLAVFGSFALAVSMVGAYTLHRFLMETRQHELAVRAALGATPRSLLRLLFKQAVSLTLVGCATGAALAFLVTSRSFTDASLAATRAFAILVASTVAAVAGIGSTVSAAKAIRRAEPASLLHTDR